MWHPKHAVWSPNFWLQESIGGPSRTGPPSKRTHLGRPRPPSPPSPGYSYLLLPLCVCLISSTWNVHSFVCLLNSYSSFKIHPQNHSRGASQELSSPMPLADESLVLPHGAAPPWMSPQPEGEPSRGAVLLASPNSEGLRERSVSASQHKLGVNSHPSLHNQMPQASISLFPHSPIFLISHIVPVFSLLLPLTIF